MEIHPIFNTSVKKLHEIYREDPFSLMFAIHFSVNQEFLEHHPDNCRILSDIYIAFCGYPSMPPPDDDRLKRMLISIHFDSGVIILMGVGLTTEMHISRYPSFVNLLNDLVECILRFEIEKFKIQTDTTDPEDDLDFLNQIEI